MKPELKRLPGDPEQLATLLQTHLPVSASLAVPRTTLRDEALNRYGARWHPRGLGCAAPAFSRALAHHGERPGSIIAEWSALALLGLTEFSDSADTTLLCSSDRRMASAPTMPTLRRRTRKHRSIDVTVGQWTVPVTPHLDTLAGCLKSLAKVEHSWDTLATLTTDGITVMSIQLIDRFRHTFHVDTDHLRTGLKGKVCAQKLNRYLLQSCGLSESPPETVLRLLAREAVADMPQVRFASQIPVYTDGTVGAPGEKQAGKTLVTVLDQADPRLRIGLQQDGEHHLERAQRDKDAEITADLLGSGWQLVRTSTGMLRKTRETKRRIRKAAEVALGRQSGGRIYDARLYDR